MIDYLKLSKIISIALRHAPEKYQIVLDKDGWGDVEILLKNIAKRHEEYNDIRYIDLVSAINSSDKKRHELKGKRIRALYGHTINILIERTNAVPPILLYHGTSNKNVKKIKVEGLQKMNRQFVHLSSNIEQARQVGFRKTNNPVVLKIKAVEAVENGLVFYKEDSIWLCDYVPPKFIEEMES